MNSDGERGGGGDDKTNQKYEKWIVDTTSTASDRSGSECVHCQKPCIRRKRKRFLKRNYDEDRYDTESFDDEVPLKPPHVKKPPTPTDGPTHRPPWAGNPNIPLRDDDKVKYQKRKEFEQGENYWRMTRRSPVPPLDSFFMEQWLEDYLGGPVKPWKQIRSTRDKVEIEPLDCDEFPSLKPYKPVLVEIETPGGQLMTVQRVGGYRELMQKRARLKQLKWIEAEDRLGHKLTFCPSASPKRASVKARKKVTKVGQTLRKSELGRPKLSTASFPSIGTSHVSVRGQKTSAKDEEESSSDGNGPNLSSSSSYSNFLDSLHFRYPVQLIPAGGGGGTDDPSADDKSRKGGAKGSVASGGVKSDTSLPKQPGGSAPSIPGSKVGIVKSRPTIQELEPDEPEPEPEENDAPSNRVPPQEDMESEGDMGGQEDDDTVVDGPVGGGPDDDDVDIGDGDTEDFGDIDESDLPPEKERDNEWLLLSTSDSEELLFQHETVQKPRKKWMKAGLSYESQNFGNALSGFMSVIAIFGRLPFFRRPDDVVGLLIFSISRFKSLPFRLTSCLLWIICVIVAESTIDIMYGNEDVDFLILEAAELQKYRCAIIGTFVNLGFVAIWSMAYILKDGYHVCQYLNFLGAAVSKFEISGTRRVRKTMVVNMIMTLTYCILMIFAFYHDNPKTVRGASRFLGQLVARPFIHRIRKLTHPYPLHFIFELAGFTLHLFCYISLRFVFTHMHMLAVVLGNLAKNWNFRFGLCFAQFGNSRRGHLFRLHAGQSIIKLFSHHRLVLGLVRFYGSVFAIPIITYYILQIGLVSTVFIVMFFDVYTQTDVKTYVPVPGTTDSIEMNTPFENVATSGFVLAHYIFEFVLLSEVISSACSPIMSGFEFVRRQGLLRCRNAHELRLIMSLQWSMSAKNPALISVNNFFYVNRPGILSSLGFSLLIVSLVIQLKQTTLVTLILKCTEGIVYTPGYDFSSCHEVRLVAAPEADLIRTENEELIGRIRSAGANGTGAG